MRIIKPLANSMSLTTANTINSAQLVYLASNARTLVSITSNTATSKGSIVVPSGQFVMVEKLATDTLTANVAIDATAIAYRG